MRTVLILLLLPATALAKRETWPELYNRGVAAYASNDFSKAGALFENATSSPERELQQRAHYNLGNTLYRLGEAGHANAESLWQRALKSYEAALTINPQDEDAKFNHEFVKKKLEELKQQQQQQQQNKDQRQEQDQQQQPPRQDQQEQQQQPQPQPSDQNQLPQDPQPQQDQAANLDKQQAKALLDNLREDERNWNFFPEVQMKDLKDSGEPAKDW